MKQRLYQLWRIIYPVLLFYAVTFAVQFVIMFVHMSVFILQGMNGENAGFSIETFEQETYKYANLYSIASSIVCILVFVILLLIEVYIQKKKGIYTKSYKTRPLAYLITVGIGITASFGVNGLIEITGISKLFPLYQEEYVEMLFHDNVIITIISSVILAPILEELVFRRFVFKRMRENVNYITATVLSSLIFGVVHGNMVQAVFAFIIGIILCYVYEKFNNLIVPIFLHAVVNATSVVVAYAPVFEKIEMTGLQYILFTIVCVLLMLLFCKVIDYKVEEVN